MPSPSSTNYIIGEMVQFIEETNARPFVSLFYLANLISISGSNIYESVSAFVCLYVKEIWNIPDKVNCMGFTLSTNVKHIRPLLETIAQAPKFLSWLKGIRESNVQIENIEIMDVDFFGSSSDPKRLGFLKIKCTAFSPSHLPVDGIVLIRGHCAVVCAIIENDDGNEFVLTTEQFRMPIKERIEEFLAGMCDEHEVEDASGETTVTMTPMLNAVLMKELKEEAGLELKKDDPNLKYMGDIMLSPGLLDEKAKMFVWHTKLTNMQIEDMLAKEHGESGTNERIKLHLYPRSEFQKQLERIGDAKTEVAFNRAKRFDSPFTKILKPIAVKQEWDQNTPFRKITSIDSLFQSTEPFVQPSSTTNPADEANMNQKLQVSIRQKMTTRSVSLSRQLSSNDEMIDPVELDDSIPIVQYNEHYEVLYDPMHPEIKMKHNYGTIENMKTAIPRRNLQECCYTDDSTTILQYDPMHPDRKMKHNYGTIEDMKTAIPRRTIQECCYTDE